MKAKEKAEKRLKQKEEKNKQQDVEQVDKKPEGEENILTSVN